MFLLSGGFYIDDEAHRARIDADGDGSIAATYGGDDRDADTHPGAVEPCDGVDRDCDGAVRTEAAWYPERTVGGPEKAFWLATYPRGGRTVHGRGGFRLGRLQRVRRG